MNYYAQLSFSAVHNAIVLAYSYYYRMCSGIVSARYYESSQTVRSVVNGSMNFHMEHFEDKGEDVTHLVKRLEGWPNQPTIMVSALSRLLGKSDDKGVLEVYYIDIRGKKRIRVIDFGRESNESVVRFPLSSAPIPMDTPSITGLDITINGVAPMIGHQAMTLSHARMFDLTTSTGTNSCMASLATSVQTMIPILVRDDLYGYFGALIEECVDKHKRTDPDDHDSISRRVDFAVIVRYSHRFPPVDFVVKYDIPVERFSFGETYLVNQQDLEESDEEEPDAEESGPDEAVHL
jgi:hypothetical protein